MIITGHRGNHGHLRGWFPLWLLGWLRGQGSCGTSTENPKALKGSHTFLE
jgi:hypothetical protein